MKIVQCEQGSPEWKAAKIGKVSSSTIADVLAKIKSGEAASRKNLRARFICEILTGELQETFTSPEMLRGREMEEAAAEQYAFLSEHPVVRVGLVLHPTIDRACASPDRLVGDHGLAEFKCPNTAQHLEFLRTEKVPGHYLKQIQWQMGCTGRAWTDFTSFDPRLPARMQTLTRRVMRDNALIAEMESEVRAFNRELEAELQEIYRRFPEREPAL